MHLSVPAVLGSALSFIIYAMGMLIGIPLAVKDTVCWLWRGCHARHPLN